MDVPITSKLQKLCRRAGIDTIDMDGQFVAIKMHFGELGNLGYLRPNYAKAVADLVKEKNGLPFLSDCNTLYPVALDQACVDLCAKEEPIRNSQLGDNLANPDFHDHGDHWHNSNPNVACEDTLIHAEKIGMGSREYELITM